MLFSPSRVPLAWLNLVENRARLLASVSGVVFAVALMFVEMGFLHGLYDSQTHVVDMMNADLVLVNRHKEAVVPKRPFPKRRLTQALGFRGIEAAYPLYVEEYRAGWKNSADGEVYPILVYGFDPDDPVFLLPELAGQAGLLKKEDMALIDSRSKDFYGNLTAGTTAELNQRTVTIAGTFVLGPDFRADGNLLVSDRTFARCFAPPRAPDRELSRVDFGLLTVADGVDVSEVQDRLRRELPPDVSVLTKQEFGNRVKKFWGESKPVGYIFGMGTIVGFLIGVTICYQILYSGVSVRLAQYATLKAIGYENAYLIKVVLQEAFFLSLLGYPPGLLASLAIYHFLQSYTGILMRLSPARMALVLGLTVVMCAAAGAIAVRKATQSDPAEVF